MPVDQQEVAQVYARTAQTTVISKPMLLVRLYDRLALELELADAYIGASDPAKANSSLQHAQKIVHVLRSSLDPDGFEGGQTLLRLYNTLVELLVEANLHKDAETVARCREIVAPLRDAWTEAVAREMQVDDVSGSLDVG
jgi:flagellar protein FliS